MFGNLRQAEKYPSQAVKTLTGIPDCNNYVEHVKANRLGKPCMSCEGSFRECQNVRYDGDGKSSIRCC